MTNTATATHTPTERCTLCGTSGRFKGDSYNSVTEPCPLACGWVAIADQRDADNARRMVRANLRWHANEINHHRGWIDSPTRIRTASTDARCFENLLTACFAGIAALHKAVNQ